MIYIYIGAPGQGKTYSATFEAIRQLKKGRQVFSNYPIITPDGYSTEIWKKEYASGKLIQGALIVIDEAWKDFNSKDWKEISPEEHSFFAECRHWENDIILISQTTARVATLAKEIAQIVRVVKKTLFFYFILGFKLEYYECLDDISRRHVTKEPLYYRHEWHWFRKYIYRSYDTHFNAREKMERFTGETWLPESRKPLIKQLRQKRKLIPQLLNASRDIRQLPDRGSKRFVQEMSLIKSDVSKDINWLFRQVKQILKRLKWEWRHRIIIPFHKGVV